MLPSGHTDGNFLLSALLASRIQDVVTSTQEPPVDDSELSSVGPMCRSPKTGQS